MTGSTVWNDTFQREGVIMKLIDLTVTRTIPAPIEQVFDVWIDSNVPGSLWYGAHRVLLNPVVDGLFYLAVNHAGRIWPHYGRFITVDRPSRLEHTWVSEPTQGIETVVTVTFEARGDQTEMTLKHTGVPDDEIGRRHEEGWTWIMSKLAQQFMAQPAARA
jgi:uncharacterized protein YndB with AHSA1/START domain